MYIQRLVPSTSEPYGSSLLFQPFIKVCVALNLQVLDFQGWWQGLLQLLGLSSVVDNQGVLVSGTSDLELGLLEWLTVSVKLLVNLDDSRLDVSSSSQFDEFLNVLDLSLKS